MATPDQIRTRARWSFVVGTVLTALLLAAIAYADNVINDVTVGGTDTITAGGTTTVNYWIVATGGSCDPADGSAATVTINAPAGVSVDTSAAPGDQNTLVFAACGTGAKQPATFTSSVAGNYLIPVSVTDAAGSYNTTPGQFTLHVLAPTDTTPPTVNCTVPDQSIWYSADVTVNCTASDSGSGLADAGDANFSLSTSVAVGTETATAQTNSRQVCDSASPQNCATAGPYTFKVDKKAPQLSACDSADGNWHAGDVTLHCTYSDGGSGPSSQQVALSTSVPAGTEDPNASASANGIQACDAVNNCAASPADIAGNKVDKKGPAVSCGAADGNWHAADVSIACAASDGGSGLASSGDASFNLTTNVPTGTEDANASTDSRTVLDAVGNSATAGPVSGNKVDKKAPEQTGCDAADGNWHADNVTLHCTYSDGGSGPGSQQVALSTNVPAGTEDPNASASANGIQACDAVDNCAASPADIAGNMIDRKAPEYSCGSADGAWHATDVSIACSASDGGSGLANPADATFDLTTNVPAGTEDANASTGTHAVADAVGNTATAGPISGNKVDKKAPAITCTSPAPVFLLNQAPANVTGVATDGGSGPASQSVSAPADTSSVLGNPKSVTLNASDSVGNSSSKACSYSVVFGFHGFFQPVDNLPTMNSVKAGSAVPVKFDLSGNQSLDIFASGYPKSKTISCADSSALDEIESTLTAGGSSLNYDASVNAPYGQYVYVWKTEKAWVGACRQLDVMLVDGTIRSAKFRFK